MPGLMPASISDVTSNGAGRPGTAAVVIRTSASARTARAARAGAAERVLGHLPRVAAGALERLQVQLDERRAHRAHLVGRAGSHVVRLDDGAEPLRGRDGLQPGDSGAQHQHLGRRNRPAAVMNSGKNRGSRIAASRTQR